MQDPNVSPLILNAQPLTAEAFAPFGEVIALDGADRRSHFKLAFERSSAANEPTLWLSYPQEVAGEVIEVAKLERHPHAAQTFIPIREGRYLVVVCHASPDGSPDLSTLHAMVARADQAVTYRRNVWHHGLTVLDQQARFAVVTTLTGYQDDDTFFQIGRPVRVTLQSTASGVGGATGALAGASGSSATGASRSQPEAKK